MQILENEDLSKHVTFRIGGIAANYYIPENREELQNCLNDIHSRNEEVYILSAGSNLLINDEKIFSNVIYMGNIDNQIMQLDDNGHFYVGASVRLQKLILTINEAGYGGIEYLFSVPAMLGGAIVMNAGRGKQNKSSISDYLDSVDVLLDGEIKEFPKEECHYSYRSSVFKNNGGIVLGARFSFPAMDNQTSAKLRKERTDFAKEHQDTSKPNFGSLFMEGSARAYKILRRVHLGYKNGVHFSEKSTNWLLNEGEGTFNQAIKVIRQAELLHKLLHSRHKLEIIVWD